MRDNRGPKHSRWKGGRYVDSHGYVYVYDGFQHVREHRLVMERHLGRKLERSEVVHHKDGNKQNNELVNLELMTHAEHCAHHMKNGVYDKMQAAKALQKKPRRTEPRKHGLTGYKYYGCRCRTCKDEIRANWRDQKRRLKTVGINLEVSK